MQIIQKRLYTTDLLTSGHGLNNRALRRSYAKGCLYYMSWQTLFYQNCWDIMNIAVPREYQYLPIKSEYGATSEISVAWYLHFYAMLRNVVPFNDGNHRITKPVDKGRCAYDALPHNFDISGFKSSNNFTTNDWWDIIALCGWFNRYVLPVTCCEHGPPSIAIAHFSKLSIGTTILAN